MADVRRSYVNVREFNPENDSEGVECVERRCEVGPPGEMSLFTDLLGDPFCRIRHAPAYTMMVAEKIYMGEERKNVIVGMIRGCIKTVTCGRKLIIGNGDSADEDDEFQFACNKFIPVYAKVAYILGLRVCPSHRRMGIGLALVNKLEQWFIQNGAEYSYLATEKDNLPSLNLFTLRCNYTRFRTPSILVQPVYAHELKIDGRVTILRLDPSDAESLYRTRFSTTEFFPRDIDSILKNKLNLGTLIAVPTGTYRAESWPGSIKFLRNAPESWAVISIWNCREVFSLQIKGTSRAGRFVVEATRLIDEMFPFLGLPSFPRVFRPFGLHFLYGLGGEGPRAGRMTRALCRHAHNLAREVGCEVVTTEVMSRDPLRRGIPHWKRLSCEEDVWCIKRLVEGCGDDGNVGDWSNRRPGSSIFVDPREF